MRRQPTTFCFLLCNGDGSSDSSLSLSSEDDSSVLDVSDSLSVKPTSPTSLACKCMVLCCCCFFENFCFKLASTSPASVELLSSPDVVSSELSSSVFSPLPDPMQVCNNQCFHSLHTITNLSHYQTLLMILGKSKNYCCFLLLNCSLLMTQYQV